MQKTGDKNQVDDFMNIDNCINNDNGCNDIRKIYCHK